MQDSTEAFGAGKKSGKVRLELACMPATAQEGQGEQGGDTERGGFGDGGDFSDHDAGEGAHVEIERAVVVAVEADEGVEPGVIELEGEVVGVVLGDERAAAHEGLAVECVFVVE